MLALLRRTCLHFQHVYSLSSWQINEEQWLLVMPVLECSQCSILSVKFWSLLWVPAQRVTHIKGQEIKFFMMDDYRRPLDGNSCLTQGRYPKLSSECFQLHCQSPWSFGVFKLNFRWISVTSWIDLDSHLKNPSVELFLCDLYIEPSFFTKEMKWRNLISREAIRFYTGLWSIEKKWKNECEVSGLKC